MPTINKMKNGKIILVFEGTYRDRRNPLLIGEYLDEYHSFEILLNYSDDVTIWSNPVEFYTFDYNLSKENASYVVSTDNNQLIYSSFIKVIKIILLKSLILLNIIEGFIFFSIVFNINNKSLFF